MRLLLFLFFCLPAFASEYSQKLREDYGELFRREKPLPKLDKKQIAIGKKIFFDKRLSITEKMSCATCHIPEKGFSDGLKVAKGNKGQDLRRRTMSLYNVGDDPFFSWDGSIKTLEEQFKTAVSHPEEMAISTDNLIKIIKNNPEYSKIFADKKITIDTIAKAVATYVKSIKAPRSKFDDWLDGDNKALNKKQLWGFEIFNQKANCTACHIGPDFSDNLRNDIGMNDPDLGYGEITGLEKDNHFFKTTGLRGIKDRAPYMHNGSFKTLKEVIEHYDDPNFKRSETDIPPEEEQDGIIAFHRFTQPLNLTKEEKEALIAFLKTL